MQATAQQRTVLVTYLQQRIASLLASMFEFKDAGEDDGMIEDYANTAQQLLTVYTAFLLNNCIATLMKDIRSALDTMIYEEEFEALEEALDGVAGFEQFNTQFIYSLT